MVEDEDVELLIPRRSEVKREGRTSPLFVTQTVPLALAAAETLRTKKRSAPKS
jgi:hypothetical protein